MTSTKRKTKRAAKRKKTNGIGETPSQHIQLTNPCRPNFPAHIMGNAAVCERVVQEKSAEGQHIVICGAGPSLADHVADYCETADQVWACNSALTWMLDNGYRCTHGFTVDQLPQMLDEWYDAPDVEYLLASTCHPHLVEYLMDHGRKIWFYHNFVGIQERDVELEVRPGEDPDDLLDDEGTVHKEITDEDGVKRWAYMRRIAYEDWLYSTFYDPTVRVGSGLNSVTRAIDLACYMGAERISVLGADSVLRARRPCPKNAVYGSPEHTRWLTEDLVMHVNGGHALASDATPLTLTGEIDGRVWHTKPDMIISAVWLVQMARDLPQVELIGDTLPNALMDKDNDFLDTLPHLSDEDGKPLRFDVQAQHRMVNTSPSVIALPHMEKVVS